LKQQAAELVNQARGEAGMAVCTSEIDKDLCAQLCADGDEDCKQPPAECDLDTEEECKA